MNATTLALLITIAVVFLVIGYCVKRCKKTDEDAVVNPQLEEPVPDDHKIEIPVSLDLPITPVTVASDTLVKSENAMKPDTVVKEETAKEEVAKEEAVKEEVAKEEVTKTDEPKPAKAKAKKASKPKAVKEPKASVKKSTKKAAKKADKDESKTEVKVAKPRGRKKKTDDALVIHVSNPVAKPGRKPRKKA